MAAGTFDLTWAAVRMGVLAAGGTAAGLIAGAVFVAQRFAMPLPEVGHIIHTAAMTGLAAGWSIGLGLAHRDVFRR